MKFIVNILSRKHNLNQLPIIVLFIISVSSPAQPPPTGLWQPAKSPLMTRWSGKVNPENAYPEYPRPQMVREAWVNLNGLWQYAIQPKDQNAPMDFEGYILVPYPVESSLSGVGKAVGKDKKLWYQRDFNLPKDWTGKRIMLNFGAVDWETAVWINGHEIGRHRGGYDAFSFDITKALNSEGAQQILISVWDPADSGDQPRGKQVAQPHSIWYTSVTGIWQTVWMEAVNSAHIISFKIETDIDQKEVTVRPVYSNTDDSFQVKAIVSKDQKHEADVTANSDNPIIIPIKEPELWSPDHPFLYDLKLVLSDKAGNEVDNVQSYFGMRKTAIGKDEQGFTRLLLNNEFVFQLGPLDQGWWPDGLYTAPADDALRYDVEMTKKLGFNMARKHVKVEPDRWYYWCDKLGLLVWQDMPSGDKYIGGDDPDIKRSSESARQFATELKAMIDGRCNHPSIILWVPYNEGWGQWETSHVTELVKTWDPTRPVNSASGWTDRGTGDVRDVHTYPAPEMPEPEKNRAIVIGEFGGLGLPMEGHTWQARDNWGYRSFQNSEELTKSYVDLIVRLYPMIGRGLSAAVYTQTSDVEVEVNGLMTYDRAVIKMDPQKVAMANFGFLPPVFKTGDDIFLETLLVELASHQPGKIYYTLDGSEPDPNSTLYDKPILLKQTTTVKSCTCFDNGYVSPVSEHCYRKTVLQKALTLDYSKPGIRYKYYENDGEEWQQLPEFTKQQAKAEGIIPQIDLSKKERRDKFGMVFEGYFKAPKDGVYTFYTASDDGSKLYIGDVEVVSNDFLHSLDERKGQIALQAGYHPLIVMFFQGYGGADLFTHFQSQDDGVKQSLKDQLFYK